ncbi:hypothetical protein BH09BAC1_BH09BAC1_12450 [soil metagenome]
MTKLILSLLLSFSLYQGTPLLTKTYLQGAWTSDNEDANALFIIEGDNIAYLEDGLKNYPYQLTDSTIVILFDGFKETVNVKILKEDEMVWINTDGQLIALRKMQHK